ncbi:MAG TPA: carboxymuconolactone decarboxylase family protein [Dehalococcoidales bacterium]|nr:carboxymuconolactone decarboxylase family protein [Dehalococcoidales bacterium]
MKRQEIYKEIENAWGMVPSQFKTISDAYLEFEWRLTKLIQTAPGPIPQKYRALMGLTLATVQRCRYGTFFHTEIARFNGATDAEIFDAMSIARSSAGWSAYLNELNPDFEQFKTDVLSMVDQVRLQTARQPY